LAKTMGSVFAAPIMAGFSVGFAFSLLEALRGPGDQGGAVVAALLVAIIFGIPSMLIIGLPGHVLLLAMRWTRWWSYAIAGGACGILWAALMMTRMKAGNDRVCAQLAAGTEYLDGWAYEAWIRGEQVCDDPITFVMRAAGFAGLLTVWGALTAVCGWLIRRPDLDRVPAASATPQTPPGSQPSSGLGDCNPR
jgi:hypothetical protein